MTTTTRNEARIASNLSQIEALRTRRNEIAANWATYGYDKTTEMCDAISNQICELYEEIDALEAGETKVAAIETPADEVAITPAVRETLAVYGWTEEEYVKEEMKKAAKKAARKMARC